MKRHYYYRYVEKLDLRSLQGERVKSFEELMIANCCSKTGSNMSPIINPRLPRAAIATTAPIFAPRRAAFTSSIPACGAPRARYTVTLMSAASKQSAFATERLDDPECGVVGDVVGGVAQDQANHICGECGGHLIAIPIKGGRIWYKCERADLCGVSLNACWACGNGWLAERRGRYAVCSAASAIHGARTG